jgi:predicted CXXCH cytochrome family protein
MVGVPGQPNGSSILCLSCHDGTIALGDVLSRSTAIAMSGGVTTIPTGPGRLGTDLSDDHPISFAYTSTLASQRGELVQPGTLTGPVRLDAAGRLQCTSCHNAHDDTNGKFLVRNNIASALCTTCHVKNYWSTSTHRTSNATWNGSGTDPWPTTTWTTVANNACENCHQPHSAPGRRRLLHQATEEGNCFACHSGTVAASTKNLQTEFNKSYRHPVTNTNGTHDPREPGVVSARHVECVDCHNPHSTRAGGTNPPGPISGVRGLSITNTEVNPATYEYQICFRCHGDSTNKPAPYTTRMITENNTRVEFNTANPSYHPVAGPGRNPNVPSLQGAPFVGLPGPLNTGSTISCSDCHNNNTGPRAGGTGPNGPHGSTYRSLLVRQYVTTDNTTESASNYALCYNCHNRTSILGNQSFPLHSFHVGGGGGGMGGGMGNVNAPCNVCHDPHGFPTNTSSNGKLINFDRSVVSPSSSGILRYQSTGTFAGTCYLTCHGQNHNPCTYGGGGGGGGMCGMGGGGGGGGGM